MDAVSGVHRHYDLGGAINQVKQEREKKLATIKTANNNQRPAATKARYSTVVRQFEHAERVMEKKHRVEGLRALVKMHQQQHEPDDEYVKGLRQWLKRAQTQLENMRP